MHRCVTAAEWLWMSTTSYSNVGNTMQLEWNTALHCTTIRKARRSCWSFCEKRMYIECCKAKSVTREQRRSRSRKDALRRKKEKRSWKKSDENIKRKQMNRRRRRRRCGCGVPKPIKNQRKQDEENGRGNRTSAKIEVEKAKNMMEGRPRGWNEALQRKKKRQSMMKKPIKQWKLDEENVADLESARKGDEKVIKRRNKEQSGEEGEENVKLTRWKEESKDEVKRCRKRKRRRCEVGWRG